MKAPFDGEISAYFKSKAQPKVSCWTPPFRTEIG